MAGDYTRVIPIYGMNIVDWDLPSVNTLLIQAKSATRVVCVQRITFVPIQYIDGVLHFIDSVTNKDIAVITVPSTAPSLGRNMFYVDFGPRGTGLSTGANLILGTTGGAVGRLHIEAFQKGQAGRTTINNQGTTAAFGWM